MYGQTLQKRQAQSIGQLLVFLPKRTQKRRYLSELADGLEEYQQLAEDISEDCDEIAGDISLDWEDRALSEITTAGCHPNRKHGVQINIRPLAGAEIVPKTVEDKVI